MKCDEVDGCGREKTHHARGICNACYMRHKRAGTLGTLRRPSRNTGLSDWRLKKAPDPDKVDHAVVERVINGDWKLRARPSERTEICRRWVASERPLAELARLTGWAPHRYFTIRDSV
jgi:hypothetical protein